MDTTRKYPRTLEEAFGPYARGTLTDEQPPVHRNDQIVMAVCILVIIAVICLASLGIIN
jgi:hypothetical protein